MAMLVNSGFELQFESFDVAFDDSNIVPCVSWKLLEARRYRLKFNKSSPRLLTPGRLLPKLSIKTGDLSVGARSALR